MILFHDLLKTQLVLKGIINVEEWDVIGQRIYYNFLQDGFFAELKNSEIMRERINLARDLEQYVGKYYSHQYVRTKVLKQNEKEISEIDKQIEDESPQQEDQTSDPNQGNDGEVGQENQ